MPYDAYVQFNSWLITTWHLPMGTLDNADPQYVGSTDMNAGIFCIFVIGGTVGTMCRFNVSR